MSFSEEWDRVYSANAHQSIWPWSDLVSYVMRYARPNYPEFRVLELGCGAGANIPFFRSLGVDYYAVEGSPAITGKLRETFVDLKDRIAVGDFTISLPFEGEFDLIVDRASLTSNSTAGMKRGLALVHSRLKPTGKYIGIDLYSTVHSDFAKGRAVDEFARTEIMDGQFAGIGVVHFSDKPHLMELFKDFSVEVLEHKMVAREVPEDHHVFASWNLVARKS